VDATKSASVCALLVASVAVPWDRVEVGVTASETTVVIESIAGQRMGAALQMAAHMDGMLHKQGH
jgi:hypothetical protein